MGRAPSFAAAVDELLDFATRLVDFPCLFVSQGRELRVATARRAGLSAPACIPLPATGSSFEPAMTHGGYFFGPLVGNDADRRFYESLGRDVPRCALVAPVPRARTKRTFFYADNAERGIAARWVAELIVLVGRLGPLRKPEQTATGKLHENRIAPQAGLTSVAAVAPNADDQRVLARLRAAAVEAEMDLAAFVDELLRRREASSRHEPAASALIDEAKVFFERLAADIPAHLARGMQAALRDMAGSRNGPSAPLTVAPTAGGVELVQTPTARTEPASYSARRQKAPRLKL
jgi:hypothetical protein